MKRKGISLVAFRDIDELRLISEKFPECFFELSYTLNEESLEKVLPLVKGRIASIHSLCPRREYFPNFASTDKKTIEWSEKELLKDAELAAHLGAENLVLHPGYLTNSLVPTDTGTRIAMMEREFVKYVLPGTGSIAKPDYIHTPEYRKAFEVMKDNIIAVSRKVREKGVNLCIENLNPRSGYMLIHPDEIIELSRFEDIRFTIDIGHLWVTTELYHMDFLSSLERILSTGKVLTTHLHSNITDGKAFIFEDSHQPLDGNNMPWKDALKLIESSGANMMIEAKTEPEHNIKLLYD